jgi:hypothetical protein
LEPAVHQQAKQQQTALVAVATPQQALELLLKAYDIPNGDGPVPRKKRWWVLIASLLGAVLLYVERDNIPLIGRETSPFLPTDSTDRHTIEPASRGHPSSLAPFSLQLEAALFYEEGGMAKLLPPGKSLTKGDGFLVHVEVDRDCYLYVLAVDSEHYLTWLFPSEPPYSSFLSKGGHQIPKNEGKPWAELDDVRGEETVLIFAADRPSSWLEMWRERSDTSSGLPTPQRYALRAEILAYLEREAKEGQGILRRLVFPHK